MTVSGLLAILVGATVLLGWWLKVDALTSLVPGLVTMKVNTAIAFVLLGLGMIGRSRPVGTPWHGRAVFPLVAMMVLTAAVGSQYVSSNDLGIDQWLFKELPGQIGTVQPNRMSAMTVLCFLLIGCGVILAAGRRTSRIVPALLIGALIVASLNVLDVVYEAALPSILAGSTQMALNTAVATMVVSIGAMGLLPDGGPLAVFLGSSTSASLARRLMAASVVAEIVLTWLRLQGEARGLYATHYDTSLMVLATLVFLAAVIWQTTRSARRIELARLAALEERDRFFEGSTDLLAVASPGGYFLRLNRAWTTTLGHDLAELRSRPFVEFVHPDDRTATATETGRLAEEGTPVFNFQNRYRHRDGSYRWLEWTASSSTDGSLLYAAARDVTARKAEEESRMAPMMADRQRLAAARRAVETIIATAAFRPVFQPVVSLADGAVVGYEALTRFDDGSRPDVMFATALECGLGVELEKVTLQAALDAAGPLPAPAWLSLNVSPTLLGDIATLHATLGQPSRALVLEVTEHETIDAYQPIREAMTRLGSGVRLAVDDAGAGVANFNHLVELHPDFVKIDASLVRGVDRDVSRAALVVGLVHFAAAAGSQLIAEGIETEAERVTVADLGVQLGQGYLLGRPAPAATWHLAPGLGVGRPAAPANAAGRRPPAVHRPPAVLRPPSVARRGSARREPGTASPHGI